MSHLPGGVILAGGRSSRIGRNKALILLRGKPIITYVYEALAKTCQDIVLTTKPSGDVKRYTDVLPDSVRLVYDVNDAQTPLVGILSGLATLNSEYAVVVACDMPFAKVQIIECLLKLGEGFDAAVPVWPDGSAEPLFAVYNVYRAIEGFKAVLHTGASSLQKALESLSHVNYISVEELKKFDPNMLSLFNINTEADLQLARMLIRNGLADIQNNLRYSNSEEVIKR